MLRVMERQPLFTRTFVIVTGSALAYFLAYAVLIPTIPIYVKDELRRGEVAVGLASGAFAFSAVFLRPVAGSLSDRRGRRGVLMTGGAIVATSVFGLLLAHSIVPVVGFRILSGAGEALFFVSAVSVVNDIAPTSRRAEAISFFSLSLYIGLSIGPPVGEAVLGRFGFDAVWLLSGSLALASLALASFVPDTRPASQTPIGGGVRRYLHPAGIRPGLLIFSSVFGFAGFLAFLPLYVRDLGLGGAGAILFMYGALIVLIRAAGARIPDLVGHERTARIGLGFSCGGLAIAGVFGSVAGLVAGTVVFAIGQGLAFPAVMALAADGAAPSERGAALGTTTAFIDLGFAMGPIAGGAIAAAFDNQATFLGGAAAAAIGIAVMFVARGRAAARAA